MKKIYQQPETTVVNVEPHGHILDDGSVRTLSGNANMNYGGGNNGNARVKDATDAYDVWDDDWSAE